MTESEYPRRNITLYLLVKESIEFQSILQEPLHSLLLVWELIEFESIVQEAEVDKNRCRLDRIATRLILSNGEVIESSDSE